MANYGDELGPIVVTALISMLVAGLVIGAGFVGLLWWLL